MNHGQIVARLANITGTNRPKAFQPGDRPFDRPASGWMGFRVWCRGLLADATTVREVIMPLSFRFHTGVIVALIQAQMPSGLGRQLEA